MFGSNGPFIRDVTFPFSFYKRLAHDPCAARNALSSMEANRKFIGMHKLNANNRVGKYLRIEAAIATEGKSKIVRGE